MLIPNSCSISQVRCHASCERVAQKKGFYSRRSSWHELRGVKLSSTHNQPRPLTPRPTHFKQDRWTRTLFFFSMGLPPSSPASMASMVSLYFVWLLLFIKIAQFRCRLLVFRHFLFDFIAACGRGGMGHGVCSPKRPPGHRFFMQTSDIFVDNFCSTSPACWGAQK